MLSLLFFCAIAYGARSNDTRTQKEFFWDELRLATWNVVLESWIGNQDLIIKNVDQANGVDVLHFTEVWSTEARDAILATPYIKKHFHHHYWPTVRQSAVTCDVSNPQVLEYAVYFIECLLLNGVDTRQVVEPLAGPLPLQCQEVAIGLALTDFNPANWLCLSCLIAEMQSLLPADALDAVGICAAGGDKYAFNGINGQLIVSRHKIENVKETQFEAWATNRINIHATINNIRVGFGHFAFNILYDADPALAPLMYGATQIDQATDFVNSNDDVVIGDFNSGGWYQPQGVDFLFSNGYASVFGQTEPDTCCPAELADYVLCAGGRQGPGFPSDHILVKAANKMKYCPWFSDIFGQRPMMSDHVGIRGKVWKPWFSQALQKEIQRRSTASAL